MVLTKETLGVRLVLQSLFWGFTPLYIWFGMIASLGPGVCDNLGLSSPVPGPVGHRIKESQTTLSCAGKFLSMTPLVTCAVRLGHLQQGSPTRRL